ncbi:unnamed protein product [Closterium sp. Naga37s-1]|nr:unnamed protein product [Closterium sp. Naga37s-1]
MDAIIYPDDIFKLLLVPLIAQQIPGFNVTFAVTPFAGQPEVRALQGRVVNPGARFHITAACVRSFFLPASFNTACYSGPTLIPVIPLSYDPLTIPATCPPGAVNMTAAKNVSGRPLDRAICAGFPYSNATRPFPDANGDVNAPYPYSPTPSPPAPVSAPSSPAPALSPPTPSTPATITGAPLPSIMSPSPPSASPPPTGPIPPPPSPKAAGASGASLAAAVLPLLVVVLMAGV